MSFNSVRRRVTDIQNRIQSCIHLFLSIVVQAEGFSHNNTRNVIRYRAITLRGFPRWVFIEEKTVIGRRENENQVKKFKVRGRKKKSESERVFLKHHSPIAVRTSSMRRRNNTKAHF